MAPEGVAALVGEQDTFPGGPLGVAELAAGLQKLAQVGSARRGSLQILPGLALLQAHPEQAGSIQQTALRPQGKACLSLDECLVRFAEPRREPIPRGVEEGREHGELAAEGSKVL